MRWTYGTLRRRRSRRGGKSAAGMARPAHLLALAPLERDQEAVAQHDGHRVPVEGIVAPPLELIPAEFLFRFFIVLLDPVPPVRILDHRRHGGPRAHAAPEELRIPAVTAHRPLADEPADMPRAVAVEAPAAECPDLR